jgi:hypothetical protein
VAAADDVPVAGSATSGRGQRDERSRPLERSATGQRIRPASTSSDGEVDDGADSAAGAPLAAVAGVFGATASGEAVGSAGAGFAFAAPLAAFGLAALAALACFGLAAAPAAAAAGADFASSAFAVADLALALDDLAVDGFALAADVFDALAPLADGLPAEGLAVPADAFPVAGFAVAAEDLVVRPAGDFAAEDFAPAARTVRADVATRAVVLAAVVVPERAALAVAVDIALAASVSDFTAVSIALVAALIACSAVVIVLAEDVALVAAVFSCAAADVTRVAAVETVRAVGAVVVVRLAVAVLAVLPVPVLPVPVLLVPVPALADLRAVVPLAAGLAVARVVVFFAAPVVDDFAELVRLALAVRGRVGFLAAGVVGTDLPPSGSVTGSLIPRSTKFYTSRTLAHQHQ